MKLHSVVHDNKSKQWCGPTAIAAVTGRTTSEIHECIRTTTRVTKVAGVHNYQLVATLKALGVTVVQYSVAGRPTLARWSKENKFLFADAPLIVLVGHHYVTLRGRQLVDNWTKTPVSLSAAPHRRKRVHCYFRIVSVSEPTWKPKPIVLDPNRNTYARLMKLAKIHGITFEQHNPGEWWVWPPASLTAQDADPCYDSHITYDVGERAEHIKLYLKALNVQY